MSYTVTELVQARRELRKPVTNIDVGGMRDRFYIGLDAQVYYQRNCQLAGTTKKGRHYRAIMYKGRYYTTYQVLQLFELMGIPPLHHVPMPTA